MFLTKKSLRRIRLLTSAYIILGIICFIISLIFSYFLVEYKLLVILGIVSLILGALFHMSGKYAEGKGKLLNSGNQLVLFELRPAEFVRLFEEKRDCPDNVIVKPDFDVLQLLVVAYEAMGDTGRTLGTLEYMLSIVPEKKRTLVKILQCSVLFDVGRTAEAEALYAQLLNSKMDIISKSTFDILTKNDRALAMGDFTTAEAHNRQMLSQSFPHITPLVSLGIHLNLAKICCKTERIEEAKAHLNYCIDNGGETVIKKEAIDILSNI